MWSYSGNPSSSPKDTVRFMIGDTVEDTGAVTDEEISFALNLNSNDTRDASITCLEALVAKYAYEVNFWLGPEKVFASARYEQSMKLLQDMRKQRSLGTAAPSADLPIAAPIFDIGMHDNHWI